MRMLYSISVVTETQGSRFCKELLYCIHLKGKYCEEYMAQYKREDAGVPDGTMNSTPYITI
jgi:hypothetical protein